MRIDIVTVFHNETNYAQHLSLFEAIRLHEGSDAMLIGVDNRSENRGFSKASNLGATRGSAPIVGFLNPDLVVKGPFLDRVESVLADPHVVITGERFGKPQWELDVWGCRDWACGAAFFVERDWWEESGGFDERFVWGWEESDLIRRTQRAGRVTRSIQLPFHHASPDVDTPVDAEYKRTNFERGAKLFYEKWPR